MEYVNKEDLIDFNRQLIERYTGTHFEPDNIKQLQPLEYLLNLCRDNIVFGEEQYPTVEHIAALLLHRMVISFMMVTNVLHCRPCATFCISMGTK